MTKQDRLDILDKSISDYFNYKSQAALENVLYQAAILLAMERGEIPEVSER